MSPTDPRTSLIHTLRHAGPVMRSMTALVLVTFSSLPQSPHRPAASLPPTPTDQQRNSGPTNTRSLLSATFTEVCSTAP